MQKTYKPDIDYSTEVWKSVPGHPGIIASDKGRVATIKGHINGNGYVTVHIPSPIPGLPAQSAGSNRPGFRTGVHQIVARTFLGVPEPGQLHVNHLDGDPTNNQIENLEWCTPGDNLRHSYRHLNRKRATPHKLKEPQRAKVRKLYATGKYTWRDLAPMFGVSYATIGKAIKEGKNVKK